MIVICFFCFYSGVFYYSSIFSVTMMLTEKMDGTLTRSMLAGIQIQYFVERKA